MANFIRPSSIQMGKKWIKREKKLTIFSLSLSVTFFNNMLGRLSPVYEERML
jgi:hypothetical protein